MFRIKAFSDGVFTIAITLLVLEIKVPQNVPSGQLGRALLRLWPSYLALVTSFWTIGVMWINHHRLFALIKRGDAYGPLFYAVLVLVGVFNATACLSSARCWQFTSRCLVGK